MAPSSGPPPGSPPPAQPLTATPPAGSTALPSGAATDAEQRIGTTIQAEYLIEKLIAEQELGPVYQAQNNRLRRRYSIQFLRRGVSPPLKALVAVREDLRKARELAAMGVLPTEQLADAQGNACFATEILPGRETLRQFVQRGPLRAPDMIVLFGVLCRTVAAMHKAGMVHGGLRPQHVVLVPPENRGAYAGRAMLMGHAVHHLSRGLPARPDEQVVDVDRLRYQAPELFATTPVPQSGQRPPGPLNRDGQRSLWDQKADVFALGALLYYCLSGKQAFPGETAEEIVAQQRLPLPLLVENPATGLTEALVPTLNVVLAGACAAEPERRIGDCAELGRALQQVARGAGLTWPDEATGKREVSLVARLSGLLLGDRSSSAPRPTPLRPMGARPVPVRQDPDGTRAARPPRKPPSGSPPVLPQAKTSSNPAKSSSNPAKISSHPAKSSSRGEADLSAENLLPDALLAETGSAPRRVRGLEVTDPALEIPDEMDTIIQQEEGEGGLRPPEGPPPGFPMKATAMLPPLLLRERTVIGREARSAAVMMRGDDTIRTVQGRDVTQLVMAVQEGLLDPESAVQMAQEGEEVDLRPPGLLGWLKGLPQLFAAHPRLLMVLIAASVVVLGGLLLAVCH